MPSAVPYLPNGDTTLKAFIFGRRTARFTKSYSRKVSRCRPSRVYYVHVSYQMVHTLELTAEALQRPN
ncbi:Uncharacterized protein APZ42_027998 [Daphnia magna]|uniref:Uncharacterized protein n=1 Tax=Daphnia magna TaxID=35525 RepID=A0A164QWV8_9CRUS|nr:Uncharacterized protein APZ42_027998 [Daphnia magna]